VFTARRCNGGQGRCGTEHRSERTAGGASAGLDDSVRIISAEWLSWLRLGIGFKKLNSTGTRYSEEEGRGRESWSRTGKDCASVLVL
jgi:hypothetical protein